MTDANKTQFLECVAEMRDLLHRQQPNRDQLEKNLERFMQERLPESALELGRRILGILSENYTNIMAIEAKRIFQRLPDGPESTELLARLDTMEAHFEEVTRLIRGVDTRVENLQNNITSSFQGVDHQLENAKRESKQLSTWCGTALVGIGGILLCVAGPIGPGIAFVGSVPLFYYGNTK